MGRDHKRIQDLALSSLLAALPLLMFCALSGGPAAAQSLRRDDGRRLLRRADEVAAEVALLRRLPLRRPLCRRVASRAQVGELIRRRVRSQYGPDEIEREGRLLGHLGLVADPQRYEERVYALLDGEVSGLYDPGDECLYIAASATLDDIDGTLAHEITHVLQDQHFDLDRLLRHVPGETDRLQAASALVEGDATAVARALSEPGGGLRRRWVREIRRALAPPLSPRGDPLSRYLDRTMAFAYADGLALVRHAHGRGGWRAVDALLRRPPVSSEAVLDPGMSDAPIDVEICSSDLGGEGRIIHRDTLGEQGLRSVLAEHIGWEAASEAAHGWGGDRALLVAVPGAPARTAAALVTVWDEAPRGEESPAARFATALARALSRRHGAPPSPSPEGDLLHRLGDDRCSGISRRGRAVVYVESLPCSAAAPTSARLLRVADQALARPES